ncbi:thiamine-phosphate kinase [Ectopseudomonas oleovorans]|uniref:Thiamine-monophosphate kinase n=1 Tax=Ectopseudomonas oleovorans TaxID=301 RepID=A0A427HR42_ECTOL|nr:MULTISPECIES: thiamine-phosphate kinase [Pseudomonas]AXO63179.1 thiamine-phosphate kinase [Pseudomonas sp. phDV1]MCR1826775.1 thiamine-phosphate kinase [Pseudomonas oleovorans]MDG9979291.1 thiamine-phosphate kinase [Pseudomonas oleovorans]MDH0567129.1 thiamine-phosphate kinase [Pseudomonas oleovorans]MDH1338530.1 thiamine-phosphate kinase [Pseudomonas oleovorans]
MNEFELIRHYFAAARCAQGGDGVVRGIGDDCALLAVPAAEQLAVSTDTLVAGVHFPDACDAFLLGQRALAVSASDLAAMGATPLAFTLAMTLPSASEAWLAEFARGLQAMAQSCSLALVGGDTTRGPLSLTLTVFGRVPAGQALLRSGAQVGDLLCVGGELGDAAGALPLVLAQRDATPEIAEPLLARYWSPQPQLALGQALRGRATAALDISDGLLADCGHIANASQVALHIELARVPLSAALRAFAGEQQARLCALGGGDDYRLAFTLPPALLADLQADWPEIRVIGRVQAGTGVELLDAAGQPIEPPRGGYQHF